MYTKSSYNMVISITGAVLAIAMLVISCVFSALNHHVLGIIFKVLISSFICGYFVLKAIYYGMDGCLGKKILFRIFDAIKIFFIGLFLAYLTLYMEGMIKWVFFSGVCIIASLSIICNAMKKFHLLDGILCFILLLLLIYVSYNLIGMNFLFYLLIGSSVSFYLFDYLAYKFNNKIIDSFELISLIPFGIFLILI